MNKNVAPKKNTVAINIANDNYRKYIFVGSHQNINYSTDCYRKFVKSITNNVIYIQVLSAFNDYSLLFRRYLQRNN